MLLKRPALTPWQSSDDRCARLGVKAGQHSSQFPSAIPTRTNQRIPTSVADSGQHDHLASRLADLRRLGVRTKAGHPITVLRRSATSQPVEDGPEPDPSMPADVTPAAITANQNDTQDVIDGLMRRLSSQIVARVAAFEETIRKDAERSLTEYRETRDHMLEAIAYLRTLRSSDAPTDR